MLPGGWRRPCGSSAGATASSRWCTSTWSTDPASVCAGGRRRSTATLCYAGFQWTTLRRSCAEHVLDRVRSDRELMDWFDRTICPCESVVQTLLVNSGRFNLCNDDLRFADFTGSRNGRPRTLTAEDIPAITGGTYHFARKFDPQRDARVLDLLDAYLLAGAAVRSSVAASRCRGRRKLPRGSAPPLRGEAAGL